MVRIFRLNGDARLDISNRVSDKFEGLLHMILMEYFPDYDQTLLYIFNDQPNSDNYLFEPGWMNQNVISFPAVDNVVKDALDYEYFLTSHPSQSTINEVLGDIGCFYLSRSSKNIGSKLFENLEPIFNYRNIVVTLESSDRTGATVRYSRILSKYSIRIYNNLNSTPVDFNTLDELKDILKKDYHAQLLVPVSISPWDTLVYRKDQTRKIDDISIQYLYECRDFEVMTYS
jgi:hypothetical protein